MYKVPEPIETLDENAWKYLKAQEFIPTKRHVTHLDLNSNRYAYVTETEIPLFYCGYKNDGKNLANFKDAYCCKFRNDNSVVIVGTKSGSLLYIGTEIRGKIIRTIKAHVGCVNRVEFIYDYDKIQNKTVSIGDDGTLQIWDIVTQTMLNIFSDSKEPLHSLAMLEQSPDIVATGSADHYIRVYNIKDSDSPIVTFNTEYPVKCLIFPSTELNYLISAGLTSLSLWDTNKLGQDKSTPLKTTSPHHMQITDLVAVDSFENNERLVISCGIDGMVKIMAVCDLREIHKYEYQANLMSIKVSKNCKNLITVGNDCHDPSKGYVYLRKLELPTEKQNVEKNVGGGFADKYLNMDLSKAVVVSHIKRSKLGRFDKLLNNHHHRQAWTYAIMSVQFYESVCSMQRAIMELCCWQALDAAIKNRKDPDVKKMLFIINKHIHTEGYTQPFLVLYKCIRKHYSIENLMRHSEFTRFQKTNKQVVEFWNKWRSNLAQF